jgi:hypothetical protein
MEHSKYYYDYTRNCGCTECSCEKKQIIPDYYKGSNGYEASKVVEGFQPENYNISTALTYLMRAGKKIYVNNSAKESMIKDIEKAIHHLQFELERNGNS